MSAGKVSVCESDGSLGMMIPRGPRCYLERQ